MRLGLDDEVITMIYFVGVLGGIVLIGHYVPSILRALALGSLWLLVWSAFVVFVLSED